MLIPLKPTGTPAVLDPTRWHVLQARKGDGADFLYAVKTTGIYCRIGCPARFPKPENTLFFDCAEQAEKAGFRPCRRCHPNSDSLVQQHKDLILNLCEIIKKSPIQPTLGILASHVGLSTSHLRRIFQRITGVTPKAYAKAIQAERLRQSLAETETVTESLHEVGFSSVGHFYGQANQILGMTPTSWRKGGDMESIFYAIQPCLLGFLLAAKTERGVCAISIGNNADELVSSLRSSFPAASLIANNTALEGIIDAILTFVDAPQTGLDLPLDIRGTAFQRQVWQILRDIPLGKTMRYAEVAEKLGITGGARAVARACAANTLAFAVPCHRVVRNGKSIGGYKWGNEIKKVLLEKEGKVAICYNAEASK